MLAKTCLCSAASWHPGSCRIRCAASTRMCRSLLGSRGANRVRRAIHTDLDPTVQAPGPEGRATGRGRGAGAPRGGRGSEGGARRSRGRGERREGRKAGAGGRRGAAAWGEGAPPEGTGSKTEAEPCTRSSGRQGARAASAQKTTSGSSTVTLARGRRERNSRRGHARTASATGASVRASGAMRFGSREGLSIARVARL